MLVNDTALAVRTLCSRAPLFGQLSATPEYGDRRVERIDNHDKYVDSVLGIRIFVLRYQWQVNTTKSKSYENYLISDCQ